MPLLQFPHEQLYPLQKEMRHKLISSHLEMS